MIVLHILGILFKILGIILLALLALILVFFLILLFVPVRYQAEIWRDEKELKVKAQVSYLLRAVRASVFFEDRKLDFSVKLLWLTLFPQNGKKKRKKKPKKGEEGNSTKDFESDSESGKESNKTEKRIENLEDHSEPEKEIKNLEGEGNPSAEEDRPEKESAEDLEDRSEPEKEIKNLESEDNSSTQEDRPEKESAEDLEENSESEEEIKNLEGEGNPSAEEDRPEKESAEDLEDSNTSDKDNLSETEDQSRREPESDQKGHGAFSWFFRLRKKLYGLWENILVKIEKIKDFLHLLLEKVKLADSSLGLIRVFFADEINKNGLRCSGKAILQLLKYVLPYKIKGELVFATGNAYSLGRALSVLSIIYPLYAKNLNIHADFEADRFRLDGHILLKGRIRLVRLLFIAVRLWFSGKLKLVLKNVKELKNSLMSAQSGQ